MHSQQLKKVYLLLTFSILLSILGLLLLFVPHLYNPSSGIFYFSSGQRMLGLIFSVLATILAFFVIFKTRGGIKWMGIALILINAAILIYWGALLYRTIMLMNRATNMYNALTPEQQKSLLENFQNR